MENHYLAVLNLAPGATERDIRRAYRRLAKQYHPDRSSSPDTADRFIEITEAYRFLTEVGPSPQQQSVAYDYDSEAQEYERWRQAAKEYARQRAAERFRQRINATLRFNRVFRWIIPLVALVELVYIVDYQLPAEQADDQVMDIAYFQHNMAGQYERVILRSRDIPIKTEDIARLSVGSEVVVATSPLLSTFLWIETAPGRYAQRLYPAYSVYYGYRFLMTLILLICLIFAVLPLRSDNKAVAGVTALLFFVVQLTLL